MLLHETMLGHHMKKSDLSKTYRIRGEFVEAIKEKSLDFIIETKKELKKQT
jgi:hypothetical protein